MVECPLPHTIKRPPSYSVIYFLTPCRNNYEQSFVSCTKFRRITFCHCMWHNSLLANTHLYRHTMYYKGCILSLNDWINYNNDASCRKCIRLDDAYKRLFANAHPSLSLPHVLVVMGPKGSQVSNRRSYKRETFPWVFGSSAYPTYMLFTIHRTLYEMNTFNAYWPLSSTRQERTTRTME